MVTDAKSGVLRRSADGGAGLLQRSRLTEPFCKVKVSKDNQEMIKERRIL
jgi:hypothetical protein